MRETCRVRRRDRSCWRAVCSKNEFPGISDQRVFCFPESANHANTHLSIWFLTTYTSDLSLHLFLAIDSYISRIFFVVHTRAIGCARIRWVRSRSVFLCDSSSCKHVRGPLVVYLTTTCTSSQDLLAQFLASSIDEARRREIVQRGPLWDWGTDLSSVFLLDMPTSLSLQAFVAASALGVVCTGYCLPFLVAHLVDSKVIEEGSCHWQLPPSLPSYYNMIRLSCHTRPHCAFSLVVASPVRGPSLDHTVSIADKDNPFSSNPFHYRPRCRGVLAMFWR